ncbi:hypothetical protein EFM1CSP_08330 [Enterococcus faecium]|nr:hypothetical protein EFM1CSP_08330 [Enterococcus faecium]
MGFDPATLHSYVSLLVFNCFILQENERKVIIRTESVIKNSSLLLYSFSLCYFAVPKKETEINLKSICSFCFHCCSCFLR